MKTTIEIQLPEELLAEARTYVNEGWAGSVDDLLADALRRYLDSHAVALIERFIRQDAEWGLHGRD